MTQAEFIEKAAAFKEAKAIIKENETTRKTLQAELMDYFKENKWTTYNFGAFTLTIVAKNPYTLLDSESVKKADPDLWAACQKTTSPSPYLDLTINNTVSTTTTNTTTTENDTTTEEQEA